jgi:hypothetical protein
MRRSIFSLLLIACSLSGEGFAQSVSAPPSGDLKAAPATSQPATAQPVRLVLQTTVKTALNATSFRWPLRCDSNGNVLLRNLVDGVPGIHKISPAGKELAVFQPNTAISDEKIAVAGYFSLTNDDVYQYVNSWNKRHLVYLYSSDGHFKSYTTLEIGFPWMPYQVAAFPSGNILVTGVEYDRDRNAARWPFTGIFSTEGTLLEEVKLEDDDAIHDMAEAGDSRVTSPETPGINWAIGSGQVDLANDGNIYIMRRLSPAVFYAISPGGEVVRRFTVDAGQPDYMPDSMHIAGNTIAVQIAHPQNGDQLIKIVDLKGNELATYHVEPASPLGHGIACYTTNPTRFTFLGEADGKVTLNIAGPQ